MIEQIKDLIDKELAKQLESIPNTVKEAVDSSIYKLIGVGKLPNSYRTTYDGPINSYISDVVRSKLDEYIEPVIDKKLKHLVSNSKTLIASIEYEIERIFKSRFQ